VLDTSPNNLYATGITGCTRTLIWHTHLISCSADGDNRVDLTPDATREFAIDPELGLSPDGTQVAVTRQKNGEDRIIDHTILMIDIGTKTRTIFGEGARVTNEQVHFSPDGTTLAIVRSVRSTERVSHPRLVLIDVATGDERIPAPEWPHWPNLAGWSTDGTHLIVTADDHGYVPVYTIDAETGETRRMTSQASRGVHTDIAPLGNGSLACVRSTLLDAPECFVIDATPKSTPRALATLSGFPNADWAEVEDCNVGSTDGTENQYFLIKPKNATGPLPTLLWIHGGPMGMFADGWHWRWNPLIAVAAGYAVATPNPRGSTGFGQEFVQGIWGNVWGDQCYRDLMAVTDALEARPDIDSERIMAMGGSFGGYMTNWIGTQTDRFRCLATHASIFTMAQFTGVTDHPPWWYLEMGGEDPYENQAHFDRYAPVQHIKNWKTPTLILHGERDYRCPISEGLNLFEALKYHGVETEMVIFPDENHWILKPQNAVVWYESVLSFVDKHMKPTGT
jgi:dipeptidyl aminopeptidase/acylaminoacyl peptidase